ncbi:unnamed protein product [Meloidogyne enterolobii]|uniref:Uncharacterized protein n=1 Tax=Meloidogyne enterolobii TaxID=390850 RepID=A0ACB0ZBN7_MELEN
MHLFIFFCFSRTLSNTFSSLFFHPLSPLNHFFCHFSLEWHYAKSSSFSPFHSLFTCLFSKFFAIPAIPRDSFFAL